MSAIPALPAFLALVLLAGAPAWGAPDPRTTPPVAPGFSGVPHAAVPQPRVGARYQLKMRAACLPLSRPESLEAVRTEVLEAVARLRP